MPLLFKKKKKNTEIPLDRRLLSYIQPKGGITYRDENLYQPEIPIFVVFIFMNFQKQSVIFGWRN